MLKKTLLLVLPLVLSLTVFSQTPAHGLKMAFEKGACKRCNEVADNRPSNVELSLINEEDGIIYLFISDIKWYKELFKRRRDGFVVDIISDSSYSCNTKAGKTTDPFRGTLSKRMYRKDMKKAGVKSPDGDIYIPVGPFPASIGKNYEMNLGIIRGKKLCKVIKFYSTPTEKGGVIEMEVLKDSANLNADQANAIRSAVMKSESKVLTFSIPFERGKYTYKSSDIEPLLAKIMSADEKVKKIRLKAYSSVEGTSRINMDLGNKRAQSINKAIQELQGISITPEIQVTENWDDFYSSVPGSPIAHLTSLDQEAVKAELKKKDVFTNAESFLANHRKAIVELEVDNVSESQMNDQEFKKQFETAIKEKKINESMFLQSEAFAGIKSKKLPADIISNVQIPQTPEFSNLIMNQVLFENEVNPENIEKTVEALQRLLVINPADHKIKYNLTAMQIKALAANKPVTQLEEVSKSFAELEKNNQIRKEQIKKMQLNIQILLTDKYAINKEEESKEKSLEYIHKNYKSLTLSDKDYLNLAKHFSNYNKLEWTEKMLSSELRKSDADEELVFHYITQIIDDTELLKKRSSKTILTNAAKINNKRFCKLFSARSTGGISFQYLEDENLKKVYCEHCK